MMRSRYSNYSAFWWVSLYNACKGRDDVIKWKHFPRYRPFMSGIRRSYSLHKASDAEVWCFLWSAPEKKKRLSRDAGDLRRYRSHYDVTTMASLYFFMQLQSTSPQVTWWPSSGLKLMTANKDALDRAKCGFGRNYFWILSSIFH